MDISIDKIARYFTRYFSQEGPVILLESQSDQHPWSQRSYLAAYPEAVIQARDDQITILQGNEKQQITANPWEALKQFRADHNNWMFGYLGYNLKNHLEDLTSANPDPIEAPDLYFMIPRVLIEFDRVSQNYLVLKGEMPDEEQILKTLNAESSLYSIQSLCAQTSQDKYIEKIRKAQQRITEGDFYEINLSHQLNGAFEGDSFALYQQMKEVGPVPFGAYLQTEDFTVCCQSPERFLRKEGGELFSQPIKGTSQRGESADEDKELKQKLISSQKEKAENLMIVDLVRNDLSRISRCGSVEVPKLFEIESFDTVHQMVSTVKAEAEESDPIAILKACFPMGSMTGAPKISAMKTIEELEEYRRGIYSGAVGYITPSGDFDFNVVIRTALLKDSELYYSVGGAITSDSDPHAEWKETLVKARAIGDC